MKNEQEGQIDEFKIAGVIMRKIYTQDEGDGITKVDIATAVNKNVTFATEEVIGAIIDKLWYGGLLVQNKKGTEIKWTTVFGKGKQLQL